MEKPDRVGAIASTVILARLVLGLGSYGLLVLAGLVFPVLREVFPLLILFGLTLTDQFDKSGFRVLLPDIAKDFGMNIGDATLVVALAATAAILLAVPIGFGIALFVAFYAPRPLASTNAIICSISTYGWSSARA